MAISSEEKFVVLHVEADDEAAKRFASAFEKVRKAEVLVRVQDGIDGMKFIMEHGAPQCVVTHLKYGSLTGLELIGWLRGCERYRELPIFVCDDSRERSDAAEKCRHLNVDGHLADEVGPHDVEGILLRVRSLRNEADAKHEALLGRIVSRMFSR